MTIALQKKPANDRAEIFTLDAVENVQQGKLIVMYTLRGWFDFMPIYAALGWLLYLNLAFITTLNMTFIVINLFIYLLFFIHFQNTEGPETVTNAVLKYKIQVARAILVKINIDNRAAFFFKKHPFVNKQQS